MKRLTLHTIVFATLLLGLNGCQKENMGDCFKSTGKVIRENRVINPFEVLLIDDGINVFVTQASELKLEVEAGENLQDLIKTESKNGILQIENDNRCNWVRSYKKDINVFISTPELKGIEYYGSGEIRFQNEFKTDLFRLNMWEASGNVHLQLNCPDIELKSHTGPTDLYCSGSGQKLVAYINGVGRMNTFELAVKEVLAVNTNSGSLSVFSDSLLNANIEGNGNIYYRGEPQITYREQGKGRLIKEGSN